MQDFFKRTKSLVRKLRTSGRFTVKSSKKNQKHAEFLQNNHGLVKMKIENLDVLGIFLEESSAVRKLSISTEIYKFSFKTLKL